MFNNYKLSCFYICFFLIILNSCGKLNQKEYTENSTSSKWKIGKQSARNLAIQSISKNAFYFSYNQSDSSINTSLMLDPNLKWETNNFTSIKNKKEEILENEFFIIHIEQKSFCFETYHKIQKIILTKICPYKNGLSVESTSTKHIFGLGQNFQYPNTTNGNWLNKQWSYPNNIYGHNFSSFNGGSISQLQFPVLFSMGDNDHSYALMLDHEGAQNWNFTQMPWQYKTNIDNIKGLIIAGKNIQQVRKNYMHLIGHPPLPPKRIFGLWLSKFGFRNWKEMIDEVTILKKNDFPIDGLVMDLQWFGGKFFNTSNQEDLSDLLTSKMGTLEFDPEYFPNSDFYLNYFRENLNVEIMPIQESYISKYLPEFQKLADKKLLAHNCETQLPSIYTDNPWWGIGGMLDWSNPETATYWFNNKIQPLIDKKIHYFWTDLGEPEMYNYQSCYWQGKTHWQIHNFYNLNWSHGLWNNYYKNGNKKRIFQLSRAGTIGSQRYGTAIWSGDISSKLSSIKTHYNMQMHMFYSGIDYYGSDVGGFHRRDDLLDGNEDDLYTIWLANSSLIDFPLRPHVWDMSGRNNTTNPAKIGHLESNLYNVKRRYELIDYYYSLAYRAYSAGEPIVAPLNYFYFTDESIRNVGDQKMLGEYLMTKLITSYNLRTTNVYFPQGNWIDWENKNIYAGNNAIIQNVPILYENKITPPLFIKEGGIIPITRNGKKIIIIYPNNKGSNFEIYNDDGISLDYMNGKYQILKISQKIYNDKIVIDIQGQNYSTMIQVIGSDVHKIRNLFIDGNKHNFTIKNNTLIFQKDSTMNKIVLQR